MSLQTVLEEIKKLKPFAEEDVDAGPVDTLSGRRGRKHQAQERLKVLRREYITDLMKSSVFIVASGVGRDEFAKIATENFGFFSADPEEFYRDLASRISPSLYSGKESVSNIFDVLGRYLEDKAMELGIIGYPQLIFKQQYRKAINSAAEFQELVKQAVNEQLGTEIVGIQAVNSLVDKAIAKGHSDKITPIVLATGDEQLALDLVKDLERLTSRVFLTVTGKASKGLKAVEGVLTLKEATPETVEQTLTTIKKSLKK